MTGLAVQRVQNEDNEALKVAQLAILARLKKELNPVSRDIIELRDVQGMRYAMIGLTLKIPIGTVMSRLARAREQLRKLVEIDAASSSTPSTR